MTTLTRADLAEALNRKLGLSRSDSLGMVESILDHMTVALEQGENVKISGFGTFLRATRASALDAIPRPGLKCRSPRAG